MTYISSPYIERQAKMNLQTQQAREKKLEEQRSAERAEKIKDIQARHKLDNLHRNFSAVSEALDDLPKRICEAFASASVAYPVEPLSEYELEILCLKKHGMTCAGFQKQYGLSYAEFESLFMERTTPDVVHPVNETLAGLYLTGPSPEAQRELDCLKYFGCSYAEFQAGIADAVEKALR